MATITTKDGTSIFHNESNREFTEAEFNAAAAYLQQALGMYNVAKEDQAELLAAMGER